MSDAPPSPETTPPAFPPAPPEAYERVAHWWRVLFPIASFFLGAALLIYSALSPSPSPTVIGVGLVLAGLGPAGLVDVIRKIPS